eukprot:3145473-Amphidinium_carterae.1
MIGLRQPIDTDGQPTVAESTSTTTTSRSRAMPEHNTVNGFPRPVPAPGDPQFAAFVHRILTT